MVLFLGLVHSQGRASPVKRSIRVTKTKRAAFPSAHCRRGAVSKRTIVRTVSVHHGATESCRPGHVSLPGQPTFDPAQAPAGREFRARNWKLPAGGNCRMRRARWIDDPVTSGRSRGANQTERDRLEDVYQECENGAIGIQIRCHMGSGFGFCWRLIRSS